MRRTAVAVATAAAGLALAGCTGQATVDSADADAGTANTATPTTPVAPPEPPPLPKPEEFKLDVVVLSEQCFGSAGCNVTYKIQVNHTAPESLPQGLSATAVYKVTGSDSPITDSFALEGGDQFRHNSMNKHYASTDTAGTELTAEVTNIVRDQ